MEININEISGDKSVEELKKIIFDLNGILSPSNNSFQYLTSAVLSF